MPFSRKSKRTRNGSSNPTAAVATPLCCLCNDEPNPIYYAAPQHQKQQQQQLSYLPKMTACTAATATSSRSLYSAASSMTERDLCLVTGVYANISDDYQIFSKILGKGHYGTVRECVHRVTRQTFAVKSIDKSKIGRLDHLQREIFLLASIDHHGIMKMVDCYEDADSVHIITEKYAGGELFDAILSNTDSLGCFSESRTVAIIKPLLEAVAYLHDNGVVHRDIKPENILFESNREDAAIKLIDFGLSRRHDVTQGPMSNPVGTAYYMSPELIKGRYDKSCDIWAVGVVAYVLLSGYPPFNGSSDVEIQDSTRRGNLQFKGAQWFNKSDDAVDFIKCLLRRDPRKRFTAKEALMHPWIRNMMNF